MNRLGMSLAMLLLAYFSADAQWRWQNPLPTGNQLLSVHFIDSINGCAVGELGTILRTTDLGVTWSEQRSGTIAPLNAVHFTSSLEGWAVGDSGFIIHTSD